jgi:hypothetical protein
MKEEDKLKNFFSGFGGLLAEREAFHSCQMEGMFRNWTFSDYLRYKLELEERQKRRLKKLNKNKFNVNV